MGGGAYASAPADAGGGVEASAVARWREASARAAEIVTRLPKSDRDSCHLIEFGFG